MSHVRANPSSEAASAIRKASPRARQMVQMSKSSSNLLRQHPIFPSTRLLFFFISVVFRKDVRCETEYQPMIHWKASWSVVSPDKSLDAKPEASGLSGHHPSDTRTRVKDTIPNHLRDSDALLIQCQTRSRINHEAADNLFLASGNNKSFK